MKSHLLMPAVIALWVSIVAFQPAWSTSSALSSAASSPLGSSFPGLRGFDLAQPPLDAGDAAAVKRLAELASSGGAAPTMAEFSRVRALEKRAAETLASAVADAASAASVAPGSRVAILRRRAAIFAALAGAIAERVGLAPQAMGVAGQPYAAGMSPVVGLPAAFTIAGPFVPGAKPRRGLSGAVAAIGESIGSFFRMSGRVAAGVAVAPVNAIGAVIDACGRRLSEARKRVVTVTDGLKEKYRGLDRGKKLMVFLDSLPDPLHGAIYTAVDTAWGLKEGAASLLRQGDRKSALPTFRVETIAAAGSPGATSANGSGRVAVPMQNNIPYPDFMRQDERPRLDLTSWRRKLIFGDPDLALSLRNAPSIASLAATLGGAEAPVFDDSSWDEVAVPSVLTDMTATDQDNAPAQYDGAAILRTACEVPADWAGGSVRVFFLGAQYITDLWVNGRYAGYHEGGFGSFCFEVGHLLLPGKGNVFTVRVENIKWDTRRDILPFSLCDWWNYGGLYREVYLEAAAAVHTARADAVPVAGSRDQVDVTAVVFNASTVAVGAQVEIEVYEAAVVNATINDPGWRSLLGYLVTAAGPFDVHCPPGAPAAVAARVTIPGARRWTMDDPNLYILRVSVVSPSGADILGTQFGLRTLIVPEGEPAIDLNGSPMPFLAGMARHEDKPGRGRALTLPDIHEDLLILRDRLGCNFIRTAHYPNHPHTYVLCDRLGLAAWEEIPVYWFDDPASWNTMEERGTGVMQWREMVFRDRNRPSVFFWSTCNECKVVGPRAAFTRRVHEELDGVYPDGRLVTQSAAADFPGPWDGSMKECDVIGWTLYFGMGFEARDSFRKDLSKCWEGTADFMRRVHRHFPHKPVFATEFGYWSCNDDSAVDDQARLFDETFKALEQFASDRPGPGFLVGASWWKAFDGYSPRSTIDTMGVVSMNRQRFKKTAENIRRAFGAHTTR